jgi:hypothetical protein
MIWAARKEVVACGRGRVLLVQGGRSIGITHDTNLAAGFALAKLVCGLPAASF